MSVFAGRFPTEDEEQIALMAWAGYQAAAMHELNLLFHIPNGGSRRKAEAGRFRAMGVKPGVPDLFLPVARGGCHGLFIELKRRENARVSEVQASWLEDLTLQGYKTAVCYGWEAAADIIMAYLKGRDSTDLLM